MSSKPWTLVSGAGLCVMALVALGACTSGGGGRFCYGNGVCCEQTTPVTCTCADGVSCCKPDGSKCVTPIDDTDPTDPDGDGPDADPSHGKPPCQILSPVTTGTADQIDTDGDGITDAVENTTGTSPSSTDSDGDGVYDGCEDKNHDGTVDSNEMDPRKADSDGDGIPDRLEDANHNGRYDIPLETNATSADTDGDGIPDGTEDRDRDGEVTVWKAHDNRATDLDDDGCYGLGEPGESDPRLPDSDGDGVPDNVQDVNKNGICDAGETCLYAADTDCDGIIDGLEDKNRNGRLDRGETDPLDPDSDHDALPDGVEDANHDGAYDPVTETSPLLPDSDFDGLLDGGEDLNHTGVVDDYPTELGCYSPDMGVCADGAACLVGAPAGMVFPQFGVATCADGSTCRRLGQCATKAICTVGCEGLGQTACSAISSCGWDTAKTKCYAAACTDESACVPAHGESDPRLYDTDGDGIPDGVEDSNRDGTTDTAMLPDRKDGSKSVRTFVETSAWLADTDCDGVPDGLEDRNLSGGAPDPGETDPRQVDTDLDGLFDGFNTAWMKLRNDQGLPIQCEDCDNTGEVTLVDLKPVETDPRNYDSDRDGLSDHCERFFVPRALDTGVTLGPTDPLVADTDGDGVLDGDEDKNHNCQWESGESDPRVKDSSIQDGSQEAAVFEVCGPSNLKQITFASTSRVELNYQLALEVERNTNNAQSKYITDAFGYDLATKTDGALDMNKDRLMGHAFQSDRSVLLDGTTRLDRLVYGFILAADATGGLDAALDARRGALAQVFASSTLTEYGALTARPAHDDLRNFPVLRAQRQYRLVLPSTMAAIDVRNQVLDAFAKPPADGSTGSTLVWEKTKPTVDLAFAPAQPGIYDHFTLYVGAVERAKMTGPDGGPLMLLIVTLTPDDSAKGANELRWYNDRLSRLEDLTGGSALARTGNPISNTCEKKNAKRASADLLWVVDDSSSMQSIIKRLQTAASDQHAVLSANSTVVDFRVAMTTTNPSRTARTRCFQGGTVVCDGKCQGNSACTDVCADQWVGCIFVCPSTWVLTGLCDATTGLCNCPAANAAQCVSSDGKCVDPNAAALGIFTDAGVAANQLPGGGGTFYNEAGRLLDCNSASTAGQDKFINYCGWFNPFGTEFSPFLSSTTTTDPAHTYYFNPVSLVDGGFLGSSPSVACDTTDKSLMDLSANAATSGACGSNLQNPPAYCCPRLTATSTCNDGPTVLESQMCDLIRAMGGLPDANNPTGAGSSGRAHAATEMGSREARRLLTSLLPAYPKNYAGADKAAHLRLDCCDSTCSPSDPTCAALCCNSCDPQTCPKSNPSCCNEPTLGLDCNISSQCQACDPRDGGYCPTTPLVTMILSDEEDFWFKDECTVNPFGGSVPASPTIDDIDKSQLPTQCRFVDGDSSTLEPCTEAYCSSQSFALDPPAGYNPDQAAWTSARSGTLKLRPACYQIYPTTTTANCNSEASCTTLCNATPGCTWNGGACKETTKACSPYLADAAVSCVGDPCPQLHGETSCNSFQTYFADARFDALKAVQGFANNLCVWDATAGACRNACSAITASYGNSQPAEYAVARAACQADARCQWNASEFSNNGDNDLRRACGLKVELNDCRACKRFKRLQDSVNGEAINDARCGLHASAGPCEIDLGCRWNAATSVCTSIAGLGIAGPVYSITREAGKPGSGGWSGSQQVTTDECKGANSTWGRGDGTAYRDLSIATRGRTQNICAASYKDFMQLLVTDIVALSRPYPLQGKPIAATIQVGLARPNGTLWEARPVLRSLTRGWNYNATANSLGFKNDPIDGECANAVTRTCGTGPDGKIDSSEIESAQKDPSIPRDKDVVVISYRQWEPVPCREECPLGTSCTRVYCAAGDTQPACGVDGECPDLADKCVGATCDANGENCSGGKCTCTTGDIVDRCRPEACGPCQYLNTSVTPAACTAEPVVPGVCNCTTLVGTSCTPGGPNVCPFGQMCDESGCVCVTKGTCPGADFDAQGHFAITSSCSVLSDCPECKAAMTCCAQWAGAAEACGVAKTEADCRAIPNSKCEWAAQGGTCVASNTPQPCCNPGEVPSCFYDVQGGATSNLGSIACKPATCSCSDPKTCQVGCEGLAQVACGGATGCSWDAGSQKCYATACQYSWKTCKNGTECTPACQPVTQFCDTTAGCVCTNNPG